MAKAIAKAPAGKKPAPSTESKPVQASSEDEKTRRVREASREMIDLHRETFKKLGQ